jgi:hypothetical protein
MPDNVFGSLNLFPKIHREWNLISLVPRDNKYYRDNKMSEIVSSPIGSKG